MNELESFTYKYSITSDGRVWQDMYDEYGILGFGVVDNPTPEQLAKARKKD